MQFGHTVFSGFLFLRKLNEFQGEVLRRQNGERLALERELEKEEREAMGVVLQKEDDKRKDKVGHMTDGLAGKLQGRSSEKSKNNFL